MVAKSSSSASEKLLVKEVFPAFTPLKAVAKCGLVAGSGMSGKRFSVCALETTLRKRDTKRKINLLFEFISTIIRFNETKITNGYLNLQYYNIKLQ